MKATSIVVAMLIVALVVLTFFLMHTMFADDGLSGLAVELLAAGVAVVLVVVSVGVTIYFQNRAETERQYRVCVFQSKMKEYTEFLELTAKADDDNRIDDAEIERIRNQARVVSMLAQGELLIELADFIDTLERTKELHGNGSVKGSFQRVIWAMRVDLDVVDLDMPDTERGKAKLAIERMVLRKSDKQAASVS